MQMLRNTKATAHAASGIFRRPELRQARVGILVAPFIVRFYHASTLASRSAAHYCAPASVIEAMGYVTKIKVAGQTLHPWLLLPQERGG